MKPDPTGGPTAHPILDPAAGAGMIGRMLRRVIFSAIRSSMQELMTPALQEVKVQVHAALQDVKDQIHELKDQVHELKVHVQELKGEMKETNSCLRTGLERLDGRIDALGERLDKRIDELALQQGRMVEEVAALKRDRESAGDLVHRITRIEDRLFARAV